MDLSKAEENGKKTGQTDLPDFPAPDATKLERDTWISDSNTPTKNTG